jgi:hypothetical protein
MIKYRLQCGEGHQFDEWFRSMSAYDERKTADDLCCPDCGDKNVAKALMAPTVGSTVGKPWQSDGPSCATASNSCADAGCPMAKSA